jgi:preprotein translocase subunit SecB
MGMPQMESTAFLSDEEDNILFANINLEWGVVESTPYHVEVSVHGRFRLPGNALDDRSSLERLIMNAVNVLIGAVREQIAKLTARGPFGEAYLPMLLISSKEVKLSVGERHAAQLKLVSADVEAAKSKD